MKHIYPVFLSTLRTIRWFRIFWLIALVGIAACQAAPTPQEPTVLAGTSQPTRSPTRKPTPTVLPSATSEWIGVDPADLRGMRIRLWHPWTGDLAEALNRLESEFNGTNPWGIWVDVVGIANQGDVFEAVQTALDTPQQPDVVVAYPEQAQAWNSEGSVILDLSDLIADPDWGIASQDVVDFPAVFWDQDWVEEKRLGVPALRSARVLFYNQTWAEELGFTRAPRTPQEFEEQACTAARANRDDPVWENDGTGGWILDYDALTISAWILGQGGEIQPDRDGAYSFDAPADEQTFRYLRGLFDDGCAWHPRLSDAYGYFATRYALFFSGSLEDIPGLTHSMEGAGSQDQWTAIPYPAVRGDQQLLVAGPSFQVLESQPDRELAAWLFVRFLTTPESQESLAQAGSVLPVRQAAIDRLEEDRGRQDAWQAVFSALDEAQGVPNAASWRVVRLVLEDAHRQLYQATTLPEDIPDILDQMEATIREILERPQE